MQNKRNNTTMRFTILFAFVAGSMVVTAHPLTTASAVLPQFTYNPSLQSMDADYVVHNTMRPKHGITDLPHVTSTAVTPTVTTMSASPELRLPSRFNGTVRFNETDCNKILSLLGLDNAVRLNTTEACADILAKLGFDFAPHNVTDHAHPQCCRCTSCVKPVQLNVTMNNCTMAKGNCTSATPPTRCRCSHCHKYSTINITSPIHNYTTGLASTHNSALYVRSTTHEPSGHSRKHIILPLSLSAAALAAVIVLPLIFCLIKRRKNNKRLVAEIKMAQVKGGPPTESRLGKPVKLFGAHRANRARAAEKGESGDLGDGIPKGWGQGGLAVV